MHRSLARPTPAVNASHGCTPLTEAESMFYRLLAQGFRPGTPPDLHPDDAAIDRLCCRQLVCGGCGRRGLDYTPMHRGRDGYRVLGVCPYCSRCEEV